MKQMTVCIIGAGYMGCIRARSALLNPLCKVTHIVDTESVRAAELARQCDCLWSTDWQAAINNPEIDIVVVSTPHKFLAPFTMAAAKLGKYVFCEKPMASSVAEAQAIVQAANSFGRKDKTPGVLVGYTLRHHTAVATAHRMLMAGEIGQPYYIRAQYGHGGRPGYDQEWRMDKKLSGGGELQDQGVHLIDLSRWFLGDFPLVSGGIGTYHWTGTAYTDPPTKSFFPTSLEDVVEDNAFILLRTKIGQAAHLHASWTQWKNSFQFEVFGREGALIISGLGGSYGPEKLMHIRRNPEGGVPDMTEVSLGDTSDVWAREWNAFIGTIQPDPSGVTQDSQSATAVEGLEVLKIVERLYDCARSGEAASSVVRNLAYQDNYDHYGPEGPNKFLKHLNSQ